MKQLQMWERIVMGVILLGGILVLLSYWIWGDWNGMSVAGMVLCLIAFILDVAKVRCPFCHHRIGMRAGKFCPFCGDQLRP